MLSATDGDDEIDDLARHLGVGGHIRQQIHVPYYTFISPWGVTVRYVLWSARLTYTLNEIRQTGRGNPVKHRPSPPLTGKQFVRLQKSKMPAGLIGRASHDRRNLLDGELALQQDVYNVESHRMGHDLQALRSLLQYPAR
jgi:hypothetical protein